MATVPEGPRLLAQGGRQARVPQRCLRRATYGRFVVLALAPIVCHDLGVSRRRLVRLGLALAALALLFVVGGPVGMHLREGPAPATLPGGVAGRWIDVGGHRVHVVEAGTGAPVVLVHGFGGTTCDWEEHVMPALAPRHRVIAIDLFGNGWSARSDAFHYGWPLWSDELVGALDALAIERAIVVGHSMGGGAAAYVAAHHPERVERLVLADALYPLEDAEISTPFRILATPVIGEAALALVAGVGAPGTSVRCAAHAAPTYAIEGSRRGWLDYLRDPGRRPQLAEAYRSLTVPTLAVHGTADAFVPIAAMRRATASLPNVRVVEVEGGSHFPHRDAPERLVQEIDRFLGSP